MKNIVLYTIKILIAAVVFYLVCPKYQIDDGGNGKIRINGITGKIEYFLYEDGKFIEYSEYFKNSHSDIIPEKEPTTTLEYSERTPGSIMLNNIGFIIGIFSFPAAICILLLLSRFLRKRKT